MRNGNPGGAAGEHAALHIAGDSATAYAALTTGALGSALCTIDLASDRTTLAEAIGAVSVVGLAVMP